jgi:iron(III) transport system substrate-binding protein
MKQKFRSQLMLIIVILTVFFAAGMTFGATSSKELVIYTPNSDNLLNATIPLFEEKYGIRVELIQGGAGELLSRIDAEKDAPYGDVIFGGGETLFNQYKAALESYTSPNDSEVIPQFRNRAGLCTNYIVEGTAIIVNTELSEGMKIEGYNDLLQPELKGKIAFADPTASSSALFQVENMLAAFGGIEEEGGWEYIKKLMANLDGKVAASSSAASKSVAEGEMTVGLLYEEAALVLVRDGAPIRVVYPEEGTFFSPTPAAIIKDCKNSENARLFIDFLISKECQASIGALGSSRPIRNDVELNSSMRPTAEIKTVEVDEARLVEIIDTIKTRYQDIFVSSYR